MLVVVRGREVGLVRTGDLTVAGRGREVAWLHEFVERIPSRGGALVIEGAPGVGKTTLWKALIEHARECGQRVLEARPVEVETTFAYGGLSDLLAAASTSEMEELPALQRAALERALLIKGGEASVEERAVCMAFRTLVREFSAREPTLIAVDDVQWLDVSTQKVLEYTLRRLAPEDAIGVVGASRSDEGLAARWQRAGLGLDLEQLEVEPLARRELNRVIAAHLGFALSRPLLARVHSASGGNPFFALEIVRPLSASCDRTRLGLDMLPLPDSLNGLVRDRWAAVSAETREVLLAAALLARPTIEVVEQIFADRERVGRAMEDAERAGLLDSVGETIRFAHPLLASSLCSETPVRVHRLLHRRLAAVVTEAEEQARHLALSKPDADREVAAALERAAVASHRRGAPESAAELADLAFQRTPAEDSAAARRRSVLLADYLSFAGDVARAKDLLETAVGDLEAGLERARALHSLARLGVAVGTTTSAVQLAEQALAEAGDDFELRVDLHTLLGWMHDDLREAATHAKKALTLLSGSGRSQPYLHYRAITAYAESQSGLGHGIPMDAVARAVELESQLEPVRVVQRASANLGKWFEWYLDAEQARDYLGVAYANALNEDESSVANVAMHLGNVELFAGNWHSAATYARESIASAETAGLDVDASWARALLANVHVQLGEMESARELLHALKADAGVADDPYLQHLAYWAEGQLELLSGDFARAADLLARRSALAERHAWNDPLHRLADADLVHALVSGGKLEQAAQCVGTLRSLPWATAHPAGTMILRCEALVLAAKGQLDAALIRGREARRAHERWPLPFQLARTLLVLGQIERRSNERRKARSSLEQAKMIFDELGARLWSELTSVELRRLGLRRPGGDELTPSERQVAEQVAAGLTNREIAAKLFISPKTVEANLSRVYRKLGIRSRAQVAARLPDADQATSSKP